MFTLSGFKYSAFSFRPIYKAFKHFYCKMIPIRRDKPEPEYSRSGYKLNPDEDLAVIDDYVPVRKEDCRLNFENEYEEFIYEKKEVKRPKSPAPGPVSSSRAPGPSARGQKEQAPQPRAGPSHSSRSKYNHFDDICQPTTRQINRASRRSRSRSRSNSPTKRLNSDRKRNLIDDKLAHGDGLPDEENDEDEDDVKENTGWKVRLDHILVAIGFAFMIGMTTFVFVSGGRNRTVPLDFNPCRYDSCMHKVNTFCVPNGFDEFFTCKCIIDHHEDNNGVCVRNYPSPAIITGNARRKIPRERLLAPSTTIPMYEPKT